SDFANQQQQNETIEETVEQLAGLNPEPATGPIDPWAGFLANSDGPYTELFPSESIHGEPVGVYTGVVRGGFEGGLDASGTLSMNISFVTGGATGEIVFDGGR